MFRICRVFELESGHMLSRHPDRCRFPHGHSRKVEVVVEARELDGNGMVCDFKAVKDAVGAFLDRFDHSLCVNTQDPMFETLKKAYGDRVIAFADTDPTTEVIARTLFDKFRELLAEYSRREDARYPIRGGVRLARVRVSETSGSWAEFEG